MKNRKTIRKIALGMQTKEERKFKGELGSPFFSKAWLHRSQAIKNRIKKQGQNIIKKTSI